MTVLEAIVLGIVQGLTEFLPVSSTAHLRIVPALLGWPDPGAPFSAVIQCGTLLAVLAYFRRDVGRIAGAMAMELREGRPAQTPNGKLGWMIAVGTLPIVVCGWAFQDVIQVELRSLYIISAAMIGLALLLVVAEVYFAYRARHGLPLKTVEEVSWFDAVVLGLVQTLSLIPGSSRSGVTIMGGLFRGMTRESAARFSFLLSLPAVFAAAVFELYSERKALLGSQADVLNLAVSTIAAAVVGYASIAFLLYYLRSHTTTVFIVYRIGLGVLILWLLSSGHLS